MWVRQCINSDHGGKSVLRPCSDLLLEIPDSRGYPLSKMCTVKSYNADSTDKYCWADTVVGQIQ